MTQGETAAPAREEPSQSGPVQQRKATEHAKGDGTSEETKLTCHAVVASGDPGPAGLDLLHRDLFDARSAVAISALRAIARVADSGSLRHVVRLLGSNDRQVRLEAIRTAGALRSPASAKLLFEMYKAASDDDVRCETLTALSKIVSTNPVLLRVIREQALSPLASADLRGCCSTLLISLGGPEKVPEVLAATTRGEAEYIFGWAFEHRDFAPSIIDFGTARFGRLPASSRKLLLDIAARTASPQAQELILLGIVDGDSEVRSASYRAIRGETIDAGHFGTCVEQLLGKTEANYSIEEEVLAAIDRLEQVAEQSEGIGASTLGRLKKRSLELFNQLSAPEQRVGSEKIELGWLILKSREYLEYYADEEFRRTLIQYLKGSGYHSADQMLALLKKTAERVEVKHFEGFRALADIIKNPKRPGAALIIRDLNIAKLGKREPFGQLIRNLRLMRLASSPAKETLGFVSRVFAWARKEQLFRLAEAGLFVLAKFDSVGATDICRKLLTPPIESKILAIATMRLMKSLNVNELQPPIASLLRGGADSYILLNLADALQSVEFSPSAEVLEAMIALVRSGDDIDVAREAAAFLGAKSVPNLLTRVADGFDRLDPARQRIVLDIFNRKLDEAKSRDTEGLSEFLYRILRNAQSALRGPAAVLLWKLGDNFAPKVISRLLHSGDNDLRIEIVHELGGHLDRTLAGEILKLLDEPHVGLQEAMRQTLTAVQEEATARYIRDFVIRYQGGELTPGETAGADGESDDNLQDLETGILTEQQAFRFEHEFTRDLAVLFTDIQGYSSKAQNLTTMQVNTLIRDYEGILLPMMANHRGELVKRMGDGHLFVFEAPLDAGLASLRLQKALKRFNSYREEELRVVVRAGIHWGQVVQRGGDVLGNNVNIASRLEGSAKGGSVLVSKALYDRWEGRIHARELGKITVKGISEPIPVYEPYEIQIDLPQSLDPLKNKGAKAVVAREPSSEKASSSAAADDEQRSTQPKPKGVSLEVGAGTVEYFSEVFSRLDALCQRAERNEVGVSAIREELAKTWKQFREMVVETLQKPETE